MDLVCSEGDTFGEQRGEGTGGYLLNDDALYTNVNQLSSEGVKNALRLAPEPKAVPDDQVRAVLSFDGSVIKYYFDQPSTR